MVQYKDFVSVVEFIPGCTLQGLDGQRALHEEGAGNLLSELGSLIALDCLLNNLDRVPAIWSNDGNLSNVMVVQGRTVVGIDQQVSAIADAGGRERYFASLRDFVSDAR